MPPPYESASAPRHREAPSGPSNSVAVVALVAFIFGVFLNGYIALSILDDDDAAASSSGDDAPIIVPAAPTAIATDTPTPLPDRTDCDEIRGTDYRSGSEREFFLANCINQVTDTPTPDPDAPALDGGTSSEEADEDATPTPEPEE